MFHKSFAHLINQEHSASLLVPLFKQVLEEKGPNFLQGIWQSSGLSFTDFIPAMEVEKFIENNVCNLIFNWF